MLGLKGTQGTLHEDGYLYFSKATLCARCAYHNVLDKARSAVEIREYWQTTDIAWLPTKNDWEGAYSRATAL